MKKVKSAVNLLIITLFILCLLIFLTVNLSPLYYWFAIRHFHLNYISGLNSTSLMKCYFFILRYLQVPWDNHLNLVFFKSSKAGLNHFLDVRHLVMLNNISLLVFGSFSIRLMRHMYLKSILWKLINPFRSFISGLFILTAMALINFQSFFIMFHRIMFRNQDWVFKVNLDPVIEVLPLGFFAGCFIIFIGTFIISLSFIIYLLKRLLTG